MGLDKKRVFIINTLYFGILLVGIFVLLKYGLPLLAPFVAALIIAFLLQRPIRFISSKLHCSKRVVAILMLLLFYCTIGLMLTLLCIRAFSASRDFVMALPRFFAVRVEPMLTTLFLSIEQLSATADASLAVTLEEMWQQLMQSLGQLISDASVRMMGGLSDVASSLPGLLIKLLLMVISSFFIAMDYDRFVAFFMRQLNEKTQKLCLQVKKYVTGTLFICIRSYALIMTITFTELTIGLTLLQIENSVMIALFIAIFDILPVLGTGGIMIPWAIITALQRNFSLAIGLLVVYLVITVIRNIIEPKIVGSQIGLHPVVTLASMFVGTQLFGIVGLFGFPIALSLIRYLNETGTIHWFK